jgi:predicted metal-dependent hydrolase
MSEMDDSIVLWPPQYTLKKSARARHVKLKTSLRHGLEVVVPLRFNAKHIPDILEKHKSWIEKKLAEIQEQSKHDHPDIVPAEIHLDAIEQTWHVSYIKMKNKTVRYVMRPKQELVLLGDVEDKAKCKKALMLWLKEIAEKYLVDSLQEISLKTNLNYKTVTIRGQRSRWGSCSSSKAINLNYKLLFLSKTLVDHILIHELCHTKHLNHSANFWRLVAIHDPLWKQNTRAVRRADKEVPGWVL